MLEFKPLSARSVVLSLMLGAHPRGMSPGQLVRAGDYFGITAATIRVALTRAVAADELRREGAHYVLGSRLLARRQRQEDHAALIPWDGTFEMTIVVSAGRPSGERSALRNSLSAARLTELREGVWMRPANLRRTWPPADSEGLRSFRATPAEDPAAIVATLWDLPAWADQAVQTLDALDTVAEPAERLAVAAQLVRHLDTDPLLPGELWPTSWPAEAARERYAAYQQELFARASSEPVRR